MRRFNPDLWEGHEADDTVPLKDIVAKDPEVSIWKVEDDKSNEVDIALALALGFDKLVPFFVIYLNKEEILELGFELRPQPGNTRYTALKDKHDNIYIPKIGDLAKLSSYIHERFQNENNYTLITEEVIKRSLVKAVDEGIIQIEDLNKPFKEVYTKAKNKT